MTIVSGPVIQPPLPVVPVDFMSAGQRVLPVEPARKVTANKDTGRSALDAEKRRARSEGRGNALDLEV
jgi:hypothetical protein